MTTTPAPVLPPISLDVAILHHTLNRAKRMLAEQLELFAQAGRDVATLTESVARKEAELKAAREAAK